MPSLSQVPAYAAFIADRDRAIEKLLNRAIAESNDLLRGTLSSACVLILSQFPSMVGSANPSQAIKHLDRMLDEAFAALAQGLARVQSRMMMHAELLASVGESEALRRAMGKPMKAKRMAKRPTRNGRDEPIEGRARLTTSKIQRDLMDAVEASVWLEEDVDALKRRLSRAIPDARAVIRPKRVIKPFKEAGFDWNEWDSEDAEDFSGFKLTGEGITLTQSPFMTDPEWEDLVDHVTSVYIPAYRGPDAVIEDPAAFERELNRLLPELGPKAFENGTAELRYAWQFEQELAHELVRQVQTGTHETAKENGISSFVWVAIIDDKTDECCAWRDALTVEEIAEALQNDHADDECQAFAPPAHFNCRCRLAPVIDAEGITPPESNLPEFEEWLNQI